MLEKLNQIPVQLRLCTYIYIYTQKRNISVIYNKEHYFLMKKKKRLQPSFRDSPCAHNGMRGGDWLCLLGPCHSSEVKSHPLQPSSATGKALAAT